MRTETHYKLTYNKIDGTRAEKTYPTLERLNAALARAKAEHPSHVFAEEIIPTEVKIAEWGDEDKKMTPAEYLAWLRSEREQEAYFRRYAPTCGRALGYDC